MRIHWFFRLSQEGRVHSTVLLSTCFIPFYELHQKLLPLHTHLKWLKEKNTFLSNFLTFWNTNASIQTGVPEPMVQWRREGGKDIVLRAESRDKQGEYYIYLFIY